MIYIILYWMMGMQVAIELNFVNGPLLVESHVGL